VSTTTALERRAALTDRLGDAPYDPVIYLARAAVHEELKYPDLAVGDAYRALLLCDDLDGGEYEEQAHDGLEAWTEDVSDMDKVILHLVVDLVEGEDVSVETLAAAASRSAYRVLASNLLECGCLRSAATFCDRGLRCTSGDLELLSTRDAIDAAARKRMRPQDIPEDGSMIPTAELPDHGSVRREIYPWNDHERDRYTASAIDELNARLRAAAPKCEVRVTCLPVLHQTVADGEEPEMCQQLGVFATEDIAPGERVLQEYSLITASNRHKEAVCDACSTELPEDPAAVLPCPDGCDAAFCSEFCLEQAMERYHPAVCDREELDMIGKDPSAFEADSSLYLLLLGRVLAIAAHEECNPLDVTEVKFLWGDFTPIGAPPSLPFTFKYNIAEPLHVLEAMDIDIYAEVASYDTWIFNTLYSKFRGVASARKSTASTGGDGRPDVAAVHPLWCLGNHSCDPNVSWEWGGNIAMHARTTRFLDEPGLRAGDELLSHYCDLDLPVKERREWASGPLGGDCMCKRCCKEAAEEEAAEAAKL